MVSKPTAVQDIAGLTDALNAKVSISAISSAKDGVSTTTPVSELALSEVRTELINLHGTDIPQSKIVGLELRLTSIEDELELLRNAVFPT